MEIILSKEIGFCFGVRRAYDLTLKTTEEQKRPYFCLGPLVHNESVNKKLEKLGIKFVSSLDDEVKNGILIIPAHGARPEIFKEAKKRELKIIDVTCPLVKKVQKTAEDLQNNGYQVIIVGDKNHTEVESIQGAIKDKGIVVENAEEVSALKNFKKNLSFGVIAQTTQSEENVQKVLEKLKKIAKKVKFCNTLCPFVSARQKEVGDLAKKVDLILIIGSQTSANTKRLVGIAQKSHKPVYHIENEKELKKEWFLNIQKVGIATGTSTPDWEIKKIVEELKKI
ncbi:MAG TPA: 4-hydroxy-3-methylbut-2-enyl diphosphate reductase [Candidatus Pacearchaeota archaeon]|nr:4-hydroxy-3-methylbut-2-enyl diphosphate reductase [Candidatus Pacearchaeota archaeon]